MNRVVDDLNTFKEISDVIITRIYDDLEDAEDNIYTNNLYKRD
ncbi:hypothetical protein [uncultured Ilyobacter sp.]|nr:hypothetical protein [uncultured Ilyobacter sp.]